MAGLARVRTSKGLFLILSLLCLVHVTSSLIDKDKLIMLKKKLQKETEELNKMKEDHEKGLADVSKQLNQGKKQLVALEEIMKESSGEFPPLLELPNIFKRFIENMEAYVDEANEDFVVDVKEKEMELEDLRNLVKPQEQHRVEL